MISRCLFLFRAKESAGRSPEGHAAAFDPLPASKPQLPALFCPALPFFWLRKSGSAAEARPPYLPLLRSCPARTRSRRQGNSAFHSFFLGYLKKAAVRLNLLKFSFLDQKGYRVAQTSAGGGRRFYFFIF